MCGFFPEDSSILSLSRSAKSTLAKCGFGTTRSTGFPNFFRYAATSLPISRILIMRPFLTVYGEYLGAGALEATATRPAYLAFRSGKRGGKTKPH